MADAQQSDQAPNEPFEFDIDPGLELRELRAAYGRLIQLRAELGEAQFAVQGQLSQWSPAAHFYHLLLAGDLALRNVRSLVARKGRLIMQEGGPNALAREVLVRGTYPRGKSQAPRMVQPPDPIEKDLLAMEVDVFAKALDVADGLREEVLQAPGLIPHHALAELTAAQWLRFARLHTEHHLAIVADIVG
ncbi:MAG: hypothetical protein ACI841_003716 [Planctomycetota bacterium]|jgi:hypothetical protein